MKVLIISDLHIDESNDWDFIDKITVNMTQRVNGKMLKNEDLFIFFLGDVINRGSIGNNAIKFSEADKFIDKLKADFSDAKILFVPGNHEIEKNSFELSEFNRFIQRHSYKKDFVFSMDKSVYSLEDANINFILVDSTLTRNHDLDGKIDVKSLKSKMKAGKNIIFMHHPPCQQEGADRSIINENELIATHSNFIFYGHQHGYVKVPDFLKGDTDIHSVGTLFKQENGCSNEFLLLDITDGRINFAYRYVWSVANFVANLLFPAKTNKISDHMPFSKPDKSETKIIRRLKKMGSNKKDDDTSFWHEYIGEDIVDVIKKSNLILLFGDAGIGKSFELANIYWRYKNDNEYFPIWVNLRNTNYSDVLKYIEFSRCNTIDRKTPFLIMDGFDEMEGGKMAELIKELGSAIHGNPEAKIILSARANYRVSIENTFDEYKILPLSTEQISKIATDKGVEKVEDFLKYLKNIDCLNLAQTPFYLFDMIRIYKETGYLPKRELLLEIMISYRFKEGDKKYPCEYKEMLMSNEYELRSHLKELSFFMQSLHIFALSNKEYTQYFSSIIRERFNKTGLIASIELDHTLAWEFEHNIFREFFVADYMVDIPFDDLLKIITYDKEMKQLRPSWVNVLSLLLPMRKDDSLIQWLIDNSPETIYKFESDRVTLEDRNKIFTHLMLDSINKNIPVYAIYEEEKLAKFFQSKSALCFLLKAINNSVNNASSLSSISILRHFKNFYDMEYEIKEAILPYLDVKQSEYIISLAVRALTQLFNDKLRPLTVEMFALLKDDPRPEVVGALCGLLNKANVADDYSGYLLKIFETDATLQENYSVWQEISTAIKSFQNTDNVFKSLYVLCSDNSYKFYRNDELFAEVITKAFETHKYDITHLLDNFVDIFVYAAGKCYGRKSNMIKQLFCDHGLLNDAFCRILKLKIPYNAMLFSIEDIMEEQLLDILISSYLAGEVDPDTYKWYARRHSKESNLFKKLNQAVFKKEGIEIQVDVAEDWEKIHREGSQRYFDSLFEKSAFATMIDELVDFLGNDITCGELLGDSFSKVPHNREDMQIIRTALYHNGYEKCKVTHFIDNIDWDAFCISKMCRMFQNHKNIEVSLVQQVYLETYFYKTIADVNFEELNKTQFYIAKRIILLQNRFKFVISDEKLLEMLWLPWYIFVPSTSSGDSETLNFVMQNISNNNTLREKILYNIKNKKLNPEASQIHIRYCENQKLEEGLDIAVTLFKDTSEGAKWYKNCTIDYLIAIKGEWFVNNLVDDTIDNAFLKYLSHKIKNENGKIIAMMVKRNSEAEGQLLYLSELLKLNNRYALEKYYELAKEAKALPDLHPEGLHIEPITMVIREINDISLSDVIINLLKLCFSKGFKDKESFGLRGGLSTAINNLIQADKFKIKEMLTALINDCPDNDKLVSMCNLHLKDIDQLIDVSCDTPWNIKTTLDFLESQRQKKQMRML